MQKQSLINIHLAISHHLQMPPHNKQWDLMQDKGFFAANRVFKGNLHDQKQKGLNKSRIHEPITQSNLEKIYTNYFIPHFDNDPTCLLNKVYFNIAFFLEKCG